jgi:hypothetical protein
MDLKKNSILAEEANDIVWKRLNAVADCYIKNERMIEFLGSCKSARGMMAWAYRMAVKRGVCQPIEKADQVIKEDLWEEANRYPLTREEKIDYCKGLFFLMSKYTG